MRSKIPIPFLSFIYNYMKKLQPVLSKEAPSLRDALWVKPVDEGINIYALVGNKWQPLVTGTPVDADSYEQAGAAATVKTELIGSVRDKKSANTINGAKAYAKDTAEAVKTYVDEKLAGLE
jgi:hypothetical protein